MGARLLVVVTAALQPVLTAIVLMDPPEILVVREMLEARVIREVLALQEHLQQQYRRPLQVVVVETQVTAALQEMAVPVVPVVPAGTKQLRAALTEMGVLAGTEGLAGVMALLHIVEQPLPEMPIIELAQVVPEEGALGHLIAVTHRLRTLVFAMLFQYQSQTKVLAVLVVAGQAGQAVFTQKLQATTALIMGVFQAQT